MAIHDSRAPGAKPVSLPAEIPADPPVPARHRRGKDAAEASVRRRSARRRGLLSNMIHAALWGGVALTAAGTTGCTTTSGLFKSAGGSGFCDEIVTKYRNRVAAEKAWHCRKAGFGAQADNDVFKAGFIDGYVDIAEGGKGCTPLVAPEKYWGWRYQSAAGQNAVGSWFGGYPLGVQAAEEDGLGTFRRLPFCDRPGRRGCGTPACGTVDPALAPAGIDPAIDPSIDPSVGRQLQSPMVGSGRVDIEQLDGPAIETDADDDGSPRPGFDDAPRRDGDLDGNRPFDRTNPFNRPLGPRNRGIDRQPATPPAGPNSPPRPRPAPSNPFDDNPLSDNPLPDAAAPIDPMELSDLMPPRPLSGEVADEAINAAKDKILDLSAGHTGSDPARVAIRPTENSVGPPASTGPINPSATDEPAMAEVTIEEIFGITDDSDGGVDVQFDDLPFSFE